MITENKNNDYDDVVNLALIAEFETMYDAMQELLDSYLADTSVRYGMSG